MRGHPGSPQAARQVRRPPSRSARRGSPRARRRAAPAPTRSSRAPRCARASTRRRPRAPRRRPGARRAAPPATSASMRRANPTRRRSAVRGRSCESTRTRSASADSASSSGLEVTADGVVAGPQAAEERARDASFELVQRPVDDPVEDRLLVREVLVERPGPDPGGRRDPVRARPSKPRSSSTDRPASRIRSTVARDRSWVGRRRIARGSVGGHRAPPVDRARERELNATEDSCQRLRHGGRDRGDGLPEFPARFRGAPRAQRGHRPPARAPGPGPAARRGARRRDRAADAAPRRGRRRARGGDAPRREPPGHDHRAAPRHRRGRPRRRPARAAALLRRSRREPAWLDRDLLERGARAYRRMGRSRDDVLLALSLIGGYRYAGPADLLVATGGLTGTTAMRRLGETTAWGYAVSRPGGMARDGEGFRVTAHVRAMHALVNDRFERRADWDSAALGLPVNRSDLAGTLALFSATAMLGVRVLGRRVPPRTRARSCTCGATSGSSWGSTRTGSSPTERAQHAFDHHLLHAQGGDPRPGAALTTALVEGTRRSHAERGHPVGGGGPDAGCSRTCACSSARRGAATWASPCSCRGRCCRSWPATSSSPGWSRAVAPGRRWLERRSDAGVEADLERLLGERPAAPGGPPGRTPSSMRTSRPAGAGPGPGRPAQRPVKRGSRRSPNAVNASARSALGRNAAFHAPRRSAGRLHAGPRSASRTSLIPRVTSGEFAAMRAGELEGRRSAARPRRRAPG